MCLADDAVAWAKHRIEERKQAAEMRLKQALLAKKVDKLTKTTMRNAKNKAKAARAVAEKSNDDDDDDALG
jgi:hypothetical protein